MLPIVHERFDNKGTVAAEYVLGLTCDKLGVPQSRMREGGDLEEMALRVRQGCIDHMKAQIEAARKGAKK